MDWEKLQLFIIPLANHSVFKRGLYAVFSDQGQSSSSG